MNTGLEEWELTGGEVDETHFFTLFAEAYLKKGDSKAGAEVLQKALDAAERRGERMYLSELHRLQGEFLLLSSVRGESEVERCFQQAITIAGEQSAKSLELRAATSLASLWNEQGKSIEARNILADLYDKFSQGLDAADLKAAKKLIDELT